MVARVARCPPSFGRRRAVACRACRKARAGSEGRRSRRRAESPSLRSARGLNARGRARASLVVAEVDRRWPAQRSGRYPFHPIWRAFGDGRLAHCSNARKCEAVGEETLGPSSQRNLHVTAHRERADPRRARVVVDRRHSGSCGWRIFTDRRHVTVSAPSESVVSRRARRWPGGATGVSKVRWPREAGGRKRRTPTWSCPPKRIWRLEPPGPPASAVQGASLGRWGETQASKRCWERTRRECS